MAKQVMPEAELERRAGDIDLPPELYPQLSLFAGLKQPPSLDRFPGSALLRHYRQGEVICRLGEAGWTAYYILTRQDLDALGALPRRRRQEAPQEKTRTEGLLRKAQADKAELEQRLRDPTAAPADKAGWQKKAAALQKDIEKLTRTAAALDEELERLPGLIALLEREIQAPRQQEPAGPQTAQKASQKIEKFIIQAEAAGDAKKAASYRELQTAAAAKKRTLADALQRADPDLAVLLRDLAAADDGLQVMATAHLPVTSATAIAPSGFWQRLQRRLFGTRSAATAAHPAFIRNDGPTDIPYDSRQTAMYEGALFGEMSCLYRTPRSATVVAARDCYVLEFLRNILDAIQKDAAYRARMDAVLRSRLVETHLRELPVFSVLTDAQLVDLQGRVELVNFAPGELILDENDRSDCMYLIGGGIVKVMNNISWLLAVDDIPDWTTLCAELAEAGGHATGPAAWVWEKLPAPLRQAVAGARQGLTAEQKADLVHALNGLLKQACLHADADFRDLWRARQLGKKAWSLLADPRQDAELQMHRCNRLLLEAVCPEAIPARKAAEEAEESYLFRAEEIADWRTFASKVIGDDKKEGEPARKLWDLLWEPIRVALRQARTVGVQVTDRPQILAALNELLTTRPLLLLPEFHRFVLAKEHVSKRIMEFLPGNEQWTPFAFENLNRACNRLLLEAVLPAGLGPSRRRTGPPAILAYRARGELLGEMGLLEGKPNSATCVAYNHPGNDPERTVGPVQLVRISKALFEDLLANVPAFRARVAEVIAARRVEAQPALAGRAAHEPRPLLHSERAEQLGLIEGQKLMLIDLDRCTRCDECVQACVSTHSDGRSRLFLDGPRFDRFLVPTTCRSCLDPVCMIGCPVGSIHRGHKGEIIIEDWCIGCTACAKQCPYGAIQMHDTGLIPAEAHGWRFQPAAGLKDAGWMRTNFADSAWATARAPFRHDRDLQTLLAARQGNAGDKAVCFRRRFQVPGESVKRGSDFRLEVTSTDAEAAVWVNGTEVKTDERARRGKREFLLPGAAKLVRAGSNVLALKVTPVGDSGDILLDVRLDEVRKPDVPQTVAAEVTERLVTQLAVVCDLCSTLPGGPACVNACPHDAALRVDARYQFPLG